MRRPRLLPFTDPRPDPEFRADAPAEVFLIGIDVLPDPLRPVAGLRARAHQQGVLGDLRRALAADAPPGPGPLLRVVDRPGNGPATAAGLLLTTIDAFTGTVRRLAAGNGCPCAGCMGLHGIRLRIAVHAVARAPAAIEHGLRILGPLLLAGPQEHGLMVLTAPGFRVFAPAGPWLSDRWRVDGMMIPVRWSALDQPLPYPVLHRPTWRGRLRSSRYLLRHVADRLPLRTRSPHRPPMSRRCP
jgi:hypothetical protein